MFPQIKWLIERSMLSHNTEWKISKSGNSDFVMIDLSDIGEYFAEENSNILYLPYGSFRFLSKYSCYRNEFPVVEWLTDLKPFDFLNYINIIYDDELEDTFLNYPYTFSSISSLLNNQNILFDYIFNKMKTTNYKVFDDQYKIFVKSNSGKKYLTGGGITPESFPHILNRTLHKNKHIDLNDEFIIASEYFDDVIDEYRCFVVNGEIVSTSSYRLNYALVEDQELKDQRGIDLVKRYANLIAHELPFSVIDVCRRKSNNAFYVVEINNPACSGFYLMHDPIKIFNSISNYIEYYIFG